MHPGDQLEVTALLQSPTGQPIPVKIPVKIPEGVTDKAVQLVIGSGSTINALEFRSSPLNAGRREAQRSLSGRSIASAATTGFMRLLAWRHSTPSCCAATNTTLAAAVA